MISFYANYVLLALAIFAFAIFIASRLDRSWLGRVIDETFVERVASTGIDPCGENGEYHSFAFAGPVFRTPVRWQAGETVAEPGFAQLDLLPA